MGIPWSVFPHPFSSYLWIVVAKGFLFQFCFAGQDLRPKEVKILSLSFFNPIWGKILDSRSKLRSPALDAMTYYKHRALLTQRGKAFRVASLFQVITRLGSRLLSMIAPKIKRNTVIAQLQFSLAKYKQALMRGLLQSYLKGSNPVLQVRV